MTTLSISKRDIAKKPDVVRAEGFIPAVMYGSKFESTPISLEAGAFKKAFKEAGESTVITLSGDGITEQALVHEVVSHPVSEDIMHVDFYVIEKGQKVVVNIPLEFVGVAPAVKELNGILVKVAHEIAVEGEPANMPHVLEVDISVLADFDSQIHAKDLRLPKGVTLEVEPEEVIALVQAYVEETEEAPAFDPEKVQVEDKGKKDEEEAA